MKKLTETITLTGFGALSGASGRFVEFLVLLQQGHCSMQDIVGHALLFFKVEPVSCILDGPRHYHPNLRFLFW